MNNLSLLKQAQILNLLIEGNSMRATSRIADVSINTVTKLLIDVGRACLVYQDKAIRNVPSQRVQYDEIWSFCHSKERDVVPECKGVLEYGDVYTWTAIDADTKLALSWLVGHRGSDHAEAFIADLASRLEGRIQLTTDGHGPYLGAVERVFGGAIDYAMLVKIYENPEPQDQCRYSPAQFVKADQRPISGHPVPEAISTSYVERQNLTMRMGMRRFIRLTNGFGKKIENLEHAVSLHFMHYNFARIHKTLRVTPAIEASSSYHVWTLEEIASLIPDPVGRPRGPYGKRQKILEISN